MKFTDEQKAILDADHKLTVEQLKEKYGGEDGEHPVITRALFETDKRLMFGDPKYWPYVETCFQINYSKYERPSRVQAIKCYGESEVIDRSRPLMIDSPECWAGMVMAPEEGMGASLGLYAPKLIDPLAPLDQTGVTNTRTLLDVLMHLDLVKDKVAVLVKDAISVQDTYTYLGKCGADCGHIGDWNGDDIHLDGNYSLPQLIAIIRRHPSLPQE